MRTKTNWLTVISLLVVIALAACGTAASPQAAEPTMSAEPVVAYTEPPTTVPTFTPELTEAPTLAPLPTDIWINSGYFGYRLMDETEVAALDLKGFTPLEAATVTFQKTIINTPEFRPTDQPTQSAEELTYVSSWRTKVILTAGDSATGYGDLAQELLQVPNPNGKGYTQTRYGAEAIEFLGYDGTRVQVVFAKDANAKKIWVNNDEVYPYAFFVRVLPAPAP